MTNLIITFFAYHVDRIWGEFSWMTHPIVRIGTLINIVESLIYKKTIQEGLYLVLIVMGLVAIGSFLLAWVLSLFPYYLEILLSSIIASMFLAHKMLYDTVHDLIDCDDKKEALSMLVSRDTDHLSESEIYKAGIETYAENLSDGVIAPLFYLLLGGLPALILYKTINTMDSMIGYKNERYERFGKVAAKLDDIANYLPSRLTALLLMILTKQKNIFAFYPHGSKHESPNAGHPIAAMALYLGVRLGGDTSYFGTLKKKAYFGLGRNQIKKEDLIRALALKKPIDITISVLLLAIICLTYLGTY